MARQSYFAEKRESNPNFFNKAPIEEIRKNVKRIIRDAKNNNISDQDYMYFTNNQVINACLQEAWDNYLSATAITNALNFYIYEGINKGIRLFPSIDLNNERIIVCNEQITANTRAQLWFHLFNMFTDIANGVVPQEALQYVNMLSGRDIGML